MFGKACDESSIAAFSVIIISPLFEQNMTALKTKLNDFMNKSAHLLPRFQSDVKNKGYPVRVSLLWHIRHSLIQCNAIHRSVALVNNRDFSAFNRYILRKTKRVISQKARRTQDIVQRANFTASAFWHFPFPALFFCCRLNMYLSPPDMDAARVAEG